MTLYINGSKSPFSYLCTAGSSLLLLQHASSSVRQPPPDRTLQTWVYASHKVIPRNAAWIVSADQLGKWPQRRRPVCRSGVLMSFHSKYRMQRRSNYQDRLGTNTGEINAPFPRTNPLHSKARSGLHTSPRGPDRRAQAPVVSSCTCRSTANRSRCLCSCPKGAPPVHRSLCAKHSLFENLLCSLSEPVSATE